MTQSGHLADHDKLKLSGMGADCIPSRTNDNVSATGMRRGRTFMKVLPTVSALVLFLFANSAFVSAKDKSTKIKVDNKPVGAGTRETGQKNKALKPDPKFKEAVPLGMRMSK